MAILYSFNHFHLACVYAPPSALAVRQSASPTSDRAGDPAALAAKAVDELRRAMAAHYPFASPFRTARDLDCLRTRLEFQLLVLDVAFQVDPFTQ